MRKLIAVLLMTALPVVAFAQVPGVLGYQARLLNADGTAATGVVSVTFAIHDAAEGGVGLWSETQQLAVTDGYYATFLGSVEPFPAGLFDGRDLYLQVTVEGDALSPRQRIGSVAYAVRATDARNVVGGVVDATSIRVGGTQIVSDDGTWVGPQTGLVGPMGPEGPAGVDGQPGPQGEQGPEGPAGSPDTGTQIVTKLNDAATTGRIRAERLAPGVVAGGANLVPDPYFGMDMSFWSVHAGAGSVVAVSDPEAGSHVFQNVTGDRAWVHSDTRIPVDRTRTYQVTGTFRRPSTAGSAGSIYLAVQLFDASGNNIQGDGTWWYYPVSNVPLTDTAWHTFTARFGARTTRGFPDDARWMTVGAILNYDGSVPGNRIYQVTALGLFDMQDDCPNGSRQAYGFCIINTGNYEFTYQQAAARCRSMGMRLCTLAEVSAAQVAGAEWCRWGWVADREILSGNDTRAYAAYPMQSPSGGCGNKIGVISTLSAFGTNWAANCCE